MEQAIQDREVVSMGGPWVTYHRPMGMRLDTQVGVLFLNGLYATRAGNGDAAVGWANGLAERGHSCFRVDLLGFGDAEGDPPEDWVGYINMGRYGAKVSAIMEELVRRYKLPGVVVAGHCAGAVSAIYAAVLSTHCRGLVLMDPYFSMQRLDAPRLREQLNLWSRRSRIGGVLSRAFDLLKQAKWSLSREELPANANVKLLRCWKEVVRGGLPVLILRAPSRGATGLKARTGEFDYLEYILASAGQHARVSIEVVDGANHSFSNCQGRAAVLQIMKRWLGSTEFPHISSSVSNVMDGKVVLMPSAREI